MQAAYDALGQRTRLTTAAGSTQYRYNAVGQLTEIRDPMGALTAMSYTATGQRASLQLPNGVTASSTYDLRDRLTALTYRKSQQTLASYTYTLDAAGRRTQVLEADGSTTYWGYDAANRLQQEIQRTGQGIIQHQASYQYDAMGNRLSQTVNGQTTSYSYNTLDQLIQAT